MFLFMPLNQDLSAEDAKKRQIFIHYEARSASKELLGYEKKHGRRNIYIKIATKFLMKC